ncbi:MAG: choice-of-anchor P family protein [Sulfurifustis sp.]
MQYYSMFHRCNAVKAATLLAGLTLWPALGIADVSGQARAVQATVLGTTTALADTGTLSGAGDAREASSLTGNIPLTGAAEVLHATTISSVDAVASEASAANVGLSLPGISIGAEFAMARALAPVSGAPSGASSIAGLTINGSPVVVTGAPNQALNLIGAKVVINEQVPSTSGMVVNALHIVITGVADVVVAGAAAGITPSTSSTLPILKLPLL